MFTLEKLLTLAAPDIADFIEKEKVRIVRHTMDGNISGNWGGFDDKLKFNQLMLERFTDGQSRNSTLNINEREKQVMGVSIFWVDKGHEQQ